MTQNKKTEAEGAHSSRQSCCRPDLTPPDYYTGVTAQATMEGVSVIIAAIRPRSNISLLKRTFRGRCDTIFSMKIYIDRALKDEWMNS